MSSRADSSAASPPDKRLHPESWLVAAGRGTDPEGPLNVPLVAASTFRLGGPRGYARGDGTPGWEALEEIVGGLEGGEAVAFASGMAAVAAVFDQLPPGAAVILPDDCYQGVAGLAAAGAAKGRWSLRTIGGADTAAWIAACAVADLVWLESPSNPLLTVADLQAICAAPRKPGAILAVDNTFATPLNQQPLALGATVSLQSATKFIGGHSDLLAGVLMTRDDDLYAEFVDRRLIYGATIGAMEAFLTVRGARTLGLRLERAQDNAMELALRLDAHGGVTRVLYPGLPAHPTHEVAKRFMAGFGAMLSFETTGDGDHAADVCARVELINHATSLGGVESTMERRAAIAGQERIPPTLIRLSVGCENVDDLWSDLVGSL